MEGVFMGVLKRGIMKEKTGFKGEKRGRKTFSARPGKGPSALSGGATKRGEKTGTGVEGEEER